MCVSWIDVLSEAKVLTPCHESKLHGKTPMSNLDEKDKKLDLSLSQMVTRCNKAHAFNLHNLQVCWSTTRSTNPQMVTRCNKAHAFNLHNLQVCWSTTRSTNRLQCIIVNMVPKFCKVFATK
jgi:hypothetical protein